jgi:hypothetical protein
MASAFFSPEDDPYDASEKMRFIEEACNAAKVIIETAENDGVLLDIITKWSEPRTVSYELTVLARNNLLDDEDN